MERQRRENEAHLIATLQVPPLNRCLASRTHGRSRDHIVTPRRRGVRSVRLVEQLIGYGGGFVVLNPHPYDT
eukprot:350458-Prorocentrum_minimum.AAC.1